MAANTLFIKTANTGGWADAYTTWGLSLSQTGLSRLMTPAPNKSAVTNKNIISHGASVVQNTFYKDVRQISLEVHITAPTIEDFMERYAAFCAQVLDAGYIRMKTSYQPDVVYHFLYLDCTQFAEYGRRMAKFTLTLEEPHPEVRTDND